MRRHEDPGVFSQVGDVLVVIGILAGGAWILQDRAPASRQTETFGASSFQAARSGQ